MALSFEESKKLLAQQMATPAVMSVAHNDVGIMTLAETGAIAAYAGDDGNWQQHPGYVYYSVFADDNISVITDTKDINLDGKQFNITQEENSQYIPFEMPRRYDNYDLVNAVISIHYETQKGTHGASKPINVTYNDEKIRFGWLVDANATADVGQLKFEIHAYGTVAGNDGVALGYVWKTKSNDTLNVLKSLCDCKEVVNHIDDSWVTELITRVAEGVASQIGDIQVGEQVAAAEAAAERAVTAANNVQTALDGYYTKDEVDNAVANVKVDLTGYATEGYVQEQIAAIPEVDLSDYALKSDIPTKLSEFDNDTQYVTTDELETAINDVDVSDQLVNYALKSELPSIEGLATETYVNEAVAAVDVSEQLQDYAKSEDVYTKSEVDTAISNVEVDLSGYYTKTEVDTKTDALSSSVSTNTSNISSLSQTVTALQGTINGIDTSPRLTYDVKYNDTEDADVGENVFAFYEISNEGQENEVREIKQKFTITGGGGGTGASSALKIGYITTSPLVVTVNDAAIIKYTFSGTDSSGDQVTEGTATWKVGGKVVATNLAVAGENSFDVTDYLTIGTQKVNLTIVDDAGSLVSKNWTVQKVDVRIESSFNDRYTTAIDRSVTFTYTPYGAVNKTVHFKLDGVEDTIETSASGTLQSYMIEPQPHGAHLLEVWMTATINNIPVETEHIYKDIIWYNEESDDAVIGCMYRNDFHGEVVARQYDTTAIVYNVFDPTTTYPVIKRYVDGNLVGTDTATESYNVWNFQTDEIGTHTLKIVVRDTEVIILVKVTELGIDVSPITNGLEIDFNPVGTTNSATDRIWSNGKYTMSVSENFDWSNGGYQTDDNGDTYFLVKAGTRVSFDYLMFSGGLNANPSVLGAEMKLIFMTENVQDKDTVWFSNVEQTITEVDGVTQTTNVGIQLGVHEGWLKTNNASDTDIEGDDNAEAIAATNTYLYMPYSEEDIIEMDINIDTLDRNNADAKAFVMSYEDGVPSKAFVYDSSDRFYQYTPQPIVIGSDYCDVRIYRMKIYSTSLTTENIMKNFIADARNSATMLNRYDRNSIYYNRETNTYTPYSGEGVIDPEKLAPVVPNVKILMLETDHFTTSKKTFVKSTFRCIHAPGGEMFNGDAYHDNWLFENGWHSGQGTTSDNYGNSSRNVDFLFNCDGVHKPSDKVEAESNYVSQVTLGYGTENATTEVVTDWKGDSGKVSLTRTSVPNNFFNMKVNVASSENVNNMLLQKRYNDFLPYVSPAQKRNPNVKSSMEFVPAILFIRETNPDISTHTEFLDTEWHFYSLGNIGDSKKTDYTRAYDPEDMNEFTLEISDNTKNNATFQSGVYIDDNGQRQIEKFTIVESEDDGDIILTPISTDKPQSFVYPITTEEWEHEDNMRHWCIYNEGFDGDHSFEARYACCGDYRDGKLVNDTSGRGKAQMKLNEAVWRAFYRWVITATDKEFVDELDEWCVRSAVEFFYAFTHIYTMMDNRAKNTFWHFAKTGTYRKVSKPVPELLHIYCELIDGEYVTTTDTAIDSTKTYYTQYAFDMHDYDNDTALGINNNGELVFPYGKEDIDYNIEGNPASGYVFNGATSVFWCRLRDLLSSEIKTTFQTVASECFSATNLINQFDAYQECFPEEIWRLDIQRKYIRTFTGESVDNSKPKHDVQYLRDMMQGRKKYQRRQWVRDQEIYFGTMNLMNHVVGDDNRITFRCFTPTGNNIVVKPDYTLKITPFADMYLSVMFGNGGVQQKRAKAGVEYTIECPLSTMDDTQVTIYGANRIQALNDLSACYIAANNFSMASKLRKLVIGNTTEGYNNSRLVSLTLGKNTLLEELDIRNCNNLTGAINLGQCSNLLRLYAEGTKITGVTFATNGKLEVAHLPNTINTLTMRHLNKLVDFDAALSQLETLTLQGGTLDSLDIVTRCIRTLRVLYLYDIAWSLNGVDLLRKIAALFYSVLTGTARVPTIKEKELADYNETWPDLEISYNTLVPQYTVTFMNPDGRVLDVQYVDKGSQPVDPLTREENPIETPTLASTVTTDYTFTGWNIELGNIFEDTVVEAVYTETLRKYTVKYVSNVGPTPIVLQETVADYGTVVPYVGDIPTYTSEESSYKYYLFDRWNQDGYVNGDKTIEAIYDSCEYSSNYFDGKDISEMSLVEIYMMIQLGLKGTINVADYVSAQDKVRVQLGNDFSYENIEEEVLIDKKTVLGNKKYIDTGINLLSEDRDFVLAIDCEGSGTSGVLAQCFSDYDTSGFKLHYSNGVQLTWGSDSCSPMSNNRREMIVLRHIKGEHGLHVYSSNTAGNAPQYIELSGVHSMKHNVSLVFGCSKLEDGTYEKHGAGIIYWSKLWYGDLGDNECSRLVCWPHETIDFEVCCEEDGAPKRYYLSNGGGKRSSLTFIASQVLSQSMKMGGAMGNSGGWPLYQLNTYLNNRIYNAFPDKWKHLMKQVVVKSTKGSQSSELTESNCYIFIPSIAEMGGESGAPYTSEGTRISHFTSNASRICCDANGTAVEYWTRSPSLGWSDYVYRIDASGAPQAVTSLSKINVYTRIMITI